MPLLLSVLQLMPETLYLTTNLIDRFLELKGVSRKNLQLVRAPGPPNPSNPTPHVPPPHPPLHTQQPFALRLPVCAENGLQASS